MQVYVEFTIICDMTDECERWGRSERSEGVDCDHYRSGDDIGMSPLPIQPPPPLTTFRLIS